MQNITVSQSPSPADSGLKTDATALVPPPRPAPAQPAEPEPAPRVPLREVARRLRAQLRDFIDNMTIAQFALCASAFLMALGLALLPPPVTASHLMLAVGAVVLLLAAVFAPSLSVAGGPQVAGLDKVQGLVEGIERKIEDLKDTQWELSENERRFRDLLDAQDDVIVRRDATGRLTFANRAFTRVFGLERKAILGQPFRPVVLDGPIVLPQGPGPHSALPRQPLVQRIETVAGGRWFAWEEHTVPAEPGRPREVQSIGRDITEARAAQAVLAQARDAAEAASRAKSRFLAVMSHEIRTPMNGILGMSSLLSETQQTPEQETYTRAIADSAKTLLGLIDEILDFSKIEAGRLDLREVPFALDGAVQSVVELLGPRAHEKGLQLAWTVQPNLPRLVVGDEARVRQILMNLIGNAIKFTDRGGVLVQLAAADLAPSAAMGAPIAFRITVEDTGIGLDAQARLSIFGEFEQADVSRTRRHAGTGLGLAISRRLAQAMGGDITVDSTPGTGSTFTASLRLRAAAGCGTIGEAMTSAWPAHRVLVAMQDVIEARALATMLQAHGHQVVHAEGGPGDVSLPEGAAVDTVIVDAGADPHAVGALLQRVRGNPAGDGPARVRGIVAILPDQRSRLKAFRAQGCAGFLVRPVRPASLLAQIAAGGDVPDIADLFAQPVAQGKQVASPGAAKTWRPNVLLAEDNEIGALLAVTMLEKSGCTVTRVRAGDEAVDAYRASIEAGSGAAGKRAFDLILMDMHMPRMDGLDATRTIKMLGGAAPGAGDRPVTIATVPPIVALTANAFAEDRCLCLEAGMDDYLAKPFDKSDLLATLEKWCRSATLGHSHGTIEEDAA